MEVVISTNVKIEIANYAKALTKYPISRKRAHVKVDNLLSALFKLGNTSFTPPICIHKDLGQSFDGAGNYRNTNLRRYNYEDESGFQWAFSCNYDFDTNTIIIVKMMPANQVKEEKSNEKNPILEFMERLDLIK